MSDDWCTIESDPGVFTELLEQVGVKGVELNELWSLDNDSIQALQEAGPIFGFIFLFKWQPGQDTSLGNRTPEAEPPQDLFFAHQVTTNACATQALLSVVMNTTHDSVELGSVLGEFKSFTASFPPDLKGEAIGSSDELKSAHNSFARKDAFLSDGRTYTPTGDEDVFHFVAYIPFQDKVYELDGLQKGPIRIGSTDNDNKTWMDVARQAIQERMAATQDVKFNLMAVVQDKRMGIEQRLADDNKQDGGILQAALAEEQAKRHQWKLENERRKHNYVPLCIELLKELARKKSLPTLVSQAQERAQAKRMKKAAAGE